MEGASGEGNTSYECTVTASEALRCLATSVLTS